MRKPNSNISSLIQKFESQIVLTMPQIKGILDTKVNMTAYRILCNLSYLSSYSHTGKYYSLTTLAKFDSNGIWEYNHVYFSRYGTLKNTVIELVNQSTAGYCAKELSEILKIPILNTLTKLYQGKQLIREQFIDSFVYFSPVNYQEQLTQRKQLSLEDEPNYLHLFFSTLNEKQRRWFAGYESLKYGYGGDKTVAEITGLDVKTIAKGRNELITRQVDVQRIRREGAGRPSLKKTKKSSDSSNS